MEELNNWNHLVEHVSCRRVWADAAKIADKEGAIAVAEYCRKNAKSEARMVVDVVRRMMEE